MCPLLCALQFHHKITLHCPFRMIDVDTSAESPLDADKSARRSLNRQSDVNN